MSAMGGDSKHPKRGRSIEEEEREGEEDGSGAPKEGKHSLHLHEGMIRPD